MSNIPSKDQILQWITDNPGRRSKRDIRSKCCVACPGNDGKNYNDDRDYIAGENILNLFMFAYVHHERPHLEETPRRPLMFQFPSKRK